MLRMNGAPGGLNVAVTRDEREKSKVKLSFVARATMGSLSRTARRQETRCEAYRHHNGHDGRKCPWVSG